MQLKAPLVTMLVCGLLLACTVSSENPEIDIAFDGEHCQASGPEVINAGSLIVDLDNQTEGVVIIYVYRLDESKTWSDMVSHYGVPGSFVLRPEWVRGMSGRDVRGDKYDREYALEPGIYGIVCLYRGSDTNGTWAATSIEVRPSGSG